MVTIHHNRPTRERIMECMPFGFSRNRRGCSGGSRSPPRGKATLQKGSPGQLFDVWARNLSPYHFSSPDRIVRQLTPMRDHAEPA